MRENLSSIRHRISPIGPRVSFQISKTKNSAPWKPFSVDKRQKKICATYSCTSRGGKICPFEMVVTTNDQFLHANRKQAGKGQAPEFTTNRRPYTK